jgi:hypothetical protein
MKKNMFGYMLMVVSIVLFSCTKSNVMHDDVAANAMQMADKEANGGGPYVLNMVIQLSGDNEVPAVSTTTKGVAHLRVSTSKKLYSKVIVQRLESGDALRFAHVHSGAAGVNGPVRIFLCHTAADFGQNIVTELTDEEYNFLLNEPAYVNAHSNFSPSGIIRGQVR